MQDPSSYSFKLSNRAGTNIYSPYGDGPISSGWQALPDSHNTIAPNASLQFSWKGTAITISGYVNSSQGPAAYMLSLDGQPPTREVVDKARMQEAVLLSKTGLPLTYHTIVLSNIAGGNLTVKELDLSISTGANATEWRDTSISATINSNSVSTPNPFFTFNGNWFPGKTSYDPPMLTTATNNASSVLSFNLSSCSAFFLYGPMTPGSGAPYNVKITPPVHTPNSSSLALNSTLGQTFNSAYTAPKDEVLFCESGMDRNMNYTVDINILPGLGQWGISKLVIFDAIDQARQDSSSKSGLIVCILMGKLYKGGVIVGVLCFIGLCLCLKGSGRGRREVWVLKRIA